MTKIELQCTSKTTMWVDSRGVWIEQKESTIFNGRRKWDRQIVCLEDKEIKKLKKLLTPFTS